MQYIYFRFLIKEKRFDERKKCINFVHSFSYCIVLKTGVHKMILYLKGDRMKIVSEVKTNKLSVIISVRIRREAAIRL